ncbi:MAG: hypothetical protein ACRC67_00945 [Inquilinus sp.]|uniref:hypothetical protein n=1 Tax=Inquilinus sp. TaxID=1932117 RepID=UPI003F31D56C
MLTTERPLLARLARQEHPAPPALTAVAAAPLTRKPAREQFMPARLAGVDGAGLPVVEPAGRGGSARLKPLAEADGLLWPPATGSGSIPSQRASASLDPCTTLIRSGPCQNSSSVCPSIRRRPALALPNRT